MEGGLKWDSRWVTPKARPFDSGIAGWGLIAREKISAGEIVCVYGGLVIPKIDIGEYGRQVSSLGIQVNEGFFICPPSAEESRAVGALNHSCEPNCGFKDALTLVAIRDIPKGTELAFDYAFSESFRFDFKCECGKPSCRGRVTPNDWKLKSLQRKYYDYFSPYLKQRMRH